MRRIVFVANGGIFFVVSQRVMSCAIRPNAKAPTAAPPTIARICSGLPKLTITANNVGSIIIRLSYFGNMTFCAALLELHRHALEPLPILFEIAAGRIAAVGVGWIADDIVNRIRAAGSAPIPDESEARERRFDCLSRPGSGLR